MSISNHVWGKSSAVDRIWSEVVGIPSARAGRRLLLVLRAFIDDSYQPDGHIVLAGHIATVESWAAFTEKWEALLPPNEKKPGKKHPFKFSRMGTRERFPRIEPYFRIIEEHVLMSVSCHLKWPDVIAAQKRLSIPNNYFIWGLWQNRYFVTFRTLMDIFHTHRHNWPFLPMDEKVDFWFDKQVESKFIYPIWDEYMDKRPDGIRPLFGGTPHFEDDEEFLPLQAADLWAGWVRRCCDEGRLDRLENCDFGLWKESRRYPRVDIELSEQDIVNNFIQMAKEQDPSIVIWDSNFPSTLFPKNAR